MTADAQVARLLSVAGELRQDVTDFLRDLVRIPSVNGQHPEQALALRILEEAEKLALPVQLEGKDASRPNVLARFGEGSNGFALIGHMDTVAAGDEQRWSSLPFEGHIQNGKMIGRGAADNKAGLACGLYTLAVLRNLGEFDPQRYSVFLAGVVDEESGACSPLGMRYLLDQGLLPARAAIYTYTSDVICIGHRGLLRVEITAHGQAAHAGIAEWHNRTFGVNAAAGLAAAILRLEALNIPTEPIAGFEHLGCTITPGTLVRAGEYPSIVPDRASAMVDIRLMPGQDSRAVLAEVSRILQAIEDERPGLRFESDLKVQIPGAAIAVDHPLALIARQHTRAVTGTAWKIQGAGPGNEGYMLIQAGIPTLCGFGPTGGNPHAVDEWVEIESLPRTMAMYAGIIQQYLAE